MTDTSATIRILYYGAGWPTNIGNAFIDLGAMAILRAAAPDAQIFFASEMPRWFFAHGAAKKSLIARVIARVGFLPKKFRKSPFWHFLRQVSTQPSMNIMDNAIDIASITQCDLVVFSGMAMCEEFIQVNGPSVLALVKRGVPVLLLGTGAQTYSERERQLFGNFLLQVNPVGFVSRDDQSYEMFADFVPRAQKGIDCAFFLPEAYTPPSLLLPPYIVAVFDSVPEPALALNGRLLIRAHHDCWGPPRRDYINSRYTLISDIPYDYLALYANAEEVHSDRVHACVAALAYGRKARLYHPTPRASLFDAVGAQKIRQELVEIDMQLLAQKKKAQIEFVKDVISTCVRKSQ